METQRRQKILDFVSDKKAFIEKEALKALANRQDWKSIIKELIQENNTFIKQREIEAKLLKTKLGVIEKKRMETSKSPIEGEEAEFNYRILSDFDITNQSYSHGTIEDFLKFFQDKFTCLEKMLKSRHTLSPKPIKQLKTVKDKDEVDLIGIVNRKWQTKKGHTGLKIEDLEASCIAILMSSERSLEEARNRVMLDDVIGIRGVKLSNELVLVKEVFWPDLPQKKMKKINKDVKIASISDMHVGSKLFLEKPFRKFIEWINGRLGSKKERKEVQKIKYLIVTGDNVDGIGIYPTQFNELNIKNVYEQYNEFSNLILEIPERIQVFIIPGQHDAVRWADPQPAIPKKVIPRLYEAENVHLLGSPSRVEIEGFKILLYHGSGVHTLFSKISGLNYKEPQKAVIELLKKRDLMPAYGLEHPYVPEERDYMVIREEPDIVMIGDLHHSGYAQYRGTRIINNSTWQDRTDYQVKLGHVPTPGIVPVIDLKSGKIKEKQFFEGGKK